MSLNKRIKILFLASWYPSRLRPLEGIFVKKHALAVAKYCDVSVLYVVLDPDLKDKKYETEISNEDNLFTVRIYLSRTKVRLPVLSFVFNTFRFISGAYFGIREIIKNSGWPHIIQVNVASRLGLAAVVLKYLKNIPYIILEHATLFVKFRDREEYLAKTPFSERFILNLNYRYSDAIAGVSSFLNNSIESKLGLHGRYFVLPNVVEIPESVASNSLKEGTLRTLAIALLNKRDKNIFELISAIAEAAKDFPSLQLHIIGEGSDRPLLEEHARSLGLIDKNVFFHGSVPNQELKDYFARTNFLVLPSKYETFSVVAAEAIANGVPVVITKCGGPEDFVTEQQGIQVENMNEKALVNGILYMCRNWQNYDSQKLRAYAEGKFSLDVIAERALEIYNCVLKGSKYYDYTGK